MTSQPSGRVVGLFRFPVKSLVGEEPEELDIDERGVVGDRVWAVRDPDGKLGSGKSSRSFRRMDGLLELSSAYDADVPVLTFPDGSVVRGDEERVHAALTRHVGRSVTLAREEGASHYDEGPLHLVGTGQLNRVGRAHGGTVDPRRLRPNVVVESDAGEEEWAGRRLRVGTAVLQVLYAMPRCVMLDLPQLGLPRDRGLLRTVTREYAGELGVVADVVTPGSVRIGDEVAVVARAAP